MSVYAYVYACGMFSLLVSPAPGVVSGPSVVIPSDSTSVISWSAPQLTYGRLTGYVLSIVQLLDYGVPVSGTAMNTTVDVIMMSYTWSGLSEYS